MHKDFDAVFGGIRENTGISSGMATDGYYWAAGENTAYYRRVQSNNRSIYREIPDLNSGMSVRCVKD